MRTVTYLAAVGLCGLLPAVSAFCADSGREDAKKHEPVRKHATASHRAKKGSPAEQLEYARSLRDAVRLKKAVRQYEALVCTWHGSREAPLAQFECAEALEKQGKYPRAFDEYQYLIDNFAGSFQYGEVLERQFRIASHVMTTKSRTLWVFPGSPAIEQALPLFEKIVANGPTWGGTPQAQFNIGWIHEQLGSFDEAISAYETTQQRYPASKFAADASWRMGYCLYRLARKSRYDERSAQVARTHIQQFLRNHPDHENVKEAIGYLDELKSRLAIMCYDRAVFYDKNVKRPQSALIAYTDFVNKFSDTDMADIARRRIAELKTESDRQKSKVE